MIKLLISMVSALALAVMLLALRQQRLDLLNEAATLHKRIEAQQARLWNQQLQIATYTAPNVVKRTVQQHDLGLTQHTSRAKLAPWIDAPGDPEGQ